MPCYTLGHRASSGLVVGHPISAYDVDIAAARKLQDLVTAALFRLKTARNNATTFNKLPLELLRIIFRYAGGGGQELDSNFAISWTCSLWRSIALADAGMWAFLTIPNIERKHHQELTTMLLSRAINSPLIVSCTEWYHLTFLQGQLRQVPRPLNVTGVTLQFPDHHHFDDYNDIFSEFNNIYLASIHLAKNYEEDSNDPLDVVVLTDHISSDLPHLRQLRLSQCRFFWNAAIYHGLTHLAIEFEGLYADWRSEGDFLQICRNSPHLCTLKLVAQRRLDSHLITMLRINLPLSIREL